jgi:hypothetical protein
MAINSMLAMMLCDVISKLPWRIIYGVEEMAQHPGKRIGVS